MRQPQTECLHAASTCRLESKSRLAAETAFFRVGWHQRALLIEELFPDAVAVEHSEHDQLERDRGRSETSGFEIAGVHLNMRTTNVHQRLEMLLGAPADHSRSWVACACRVPGDE